jgi:hypothetical protein
MEEQAIARSKEEQAIARSKEVRAAVGDIQLQTRSRQTIKDRGSFFLNID